METLNQYSMFMAKGCWNFERLIEKKLQESEIKMRTESVDQMKIANEYALIDCSKLI